MNHPPHTTEAERAALTDEQILTRLDELAQAAWSLEPDASPLLCHCGDDHDSVDGAPVLSQTCIWDNDHELSVYYDDRKPDLKMGDQVTVGGGRVPWTVVGPSDRGGYTLKRISSFGSARFQRVDTDRVHPYA